MPLRCGKEEWCGLLFDRDVVRIRVVFRENQFGCLESAFARSGNEAAV
jgi:hypothetical protein